tara:strand:- start:302 stop:1780 length:1479 start_codon:yes stop_codon:yes gene_type:complete
MGKFVSEISKIGWNFQNSYVCLPEAMYSRLKPIPVKFPKLIIFNELLSQELGLNFYNIKSNDIASMLVGNLLPEGSECIAQAYAGHQFGHFTILGDGRAIVIGEHVSKNNKKFDIQFKGSGQTPYSRNGDGRAALGPMLREYIISEAIHFLGIPTTRSLAVVKTGENVIREKPLPGAILTRVAKSHIRVGTFQYAAVKTNINDLKKLFYYTIERHYPKLKEIKNPALGLLNIVMENQIKLVTNWMRVGFIHGVMNTDNMTISGETIDYGPCAFMDIYDPETVFSSIDLGGRYAYFNQPGITKWNLLRFAECLIPLIHEKEDRSIDLIKENINNFSKVYEKNWLDMMRAKLGLFEAQVNDSKLINDLLLWMNQNKADYTNTFCALTKENILEDRLYKNKEFINWHQQWKYRLTMNKKPINQSLNLMKKNNPLIIPRNHKVEEALMEATDNDNLEPLNKLLQVLKKPYEEQPGIKNYQSLPLSNEKVYKTYCGT